MTDPSSVTAGHEVPEETREYLERSLEAVSSLADYWCDNSGFVLTSELGLEREVLTTASTGVLASEAVMASLDHLHMVGTFVLSERRLTAFSIFTVTRSAVHSAALACWLLRPDRDERRERALNLTRQQHRNLKTAAEEMIGPNRAKTPENEAYNERVAAAKVAVTKATTVLDSVDSDVSRLGINADSVTRQPRDQAMIADAAGMVDPTRAHYADFGTVVEIRRTWRMLSAHAHGQAWVANLSATSVEEEDGIARTMWNPQPWALTQGVVVALDLLAAATHRYQTLAGVAA